MEIDLSDFNFNLSERWLISSLTVLLLALVLGVLGWFVLPDGRVLTWTEWAVFKQQAAYRGELDSLTKSSEDLSILLANRADPIRANLVMIQMMERLQDVQQPGLLAAKEALLVAADSVAAWSLGQAEHDAAVASLDMANQVILDVMARDAQP